MAISEELRSKISVTGPYKRNGTDRLYGRAYNETDTRVPQAKWFPLGTSNYNRAEDELKYRKVQIWSGEWDPAGRALQNQGILWKLYGSGLRRRFR